MLLPFAFYAYPEWLNKIHVYFLRIFSDDGTSRTKFSNVLMMIQPISLHLEGIFLLRDHVIQIILHKNSFVKMRWFDAKTCENDLWNKWYSECEVRRGASFPCFDMAVILCVLNTKAGWINNVGFFFTLVQSYDIYKQTKSNSDHNLGWG